MCIVKILPKTKEFDKELIDFLFEKSTYLKRDIYIQNILNTESSTISISEIFESNAEIELNEVYGSTFQSHWRNNKEIYAISHLVKKIFKINETFYGILEETPYGTIVDFEKGVLRPVYYRPKEDSNEYKIATFDIDFNITQDKMS
jgi:hypothetical protein